MWNQSVRVDPHGTWPPMGGPLPSRFNMAGQWAQELHLALSEVHPPHPAWPRNLGER